MRRFIPSWLNGIGAGVLLAVFAVGFQAYFTFTKVYGQNADGLGRILTRSPWPMRLVFGAEERWPGGIWFFLDMVWFWSGVSAAMACFSAGAKLRDRWRPSHIEVASTARSLSSIAICGIVAFGVFAGLHKAIELGIDNGLGASASQGELGPHFSGKAYRYIGDFFQNYAYIRADEDGNFWGELADRKFDADVWIAQEEGLILFKQANAARFSVVDISDPTTHTLKAADLTFQDVPKDSLLAKAWERASNPSAYQQDWRTGKQQQWVYVDVTAVPKPFLVGRFFVGAVIKSEPESGLLFVPVIVVKQQRLDFYLDPDKKKFAPVATDLLGTPLEEMKYREMEPGGLADALWKFIAKNKQN